MPKACWIANGDIHDLDALWRYRDANRATLDKYDAKFIVVHGQQRVVEGTSRSSQTVVEFPSYEAAIAAYEDPGYQEAAKIRMAAFLPKSLMLRAVLIALSSMAALTIAAGALAAGLGSSAISFDAALIVKAFASCGLAFIITPLALKSALDRDASA